MITREYMLGEHLPHLYIVLRVRTGTCLHSHIIYMPLRYAI